MRKGRTGKPQSEEARAKMSRAHRQRGTLVPGTDPWTAEEDEAVRTMRPAEAVKKTGRTVQAVWSRRRVPGLRDGRGGRPCRARSRRSVGVADEGEGGPVVRMLV